MQNKQFELINEQFSPLFRIMSVHDPKDPKRRKFENNICAFHIGNGFVLSVAHNLRTMAPLFKSIENAIFMKEVYPRLNPAQVQMFDNCYPLDELTNKRHERFTNQNDVTIIREILKQINYDLRWITLMEKEIVKTQLLVQFSFPSFYMNENLTNYFNESNLFYEEIINKHTFLLDVELVEAFYADDMALYKIVNTPPEVIACIPFLEPDFSVFTDDKKDFYCLQSSTTNEIGRMVSKAQIEGYIDHFNMFNDPIGGNYRIEGFRYLIKGYFRFGSSGAPYVFYDRTSGKFKANGVQSEACPIQLSIENKREGNYQYVNAIASPLSIIEERVMNHIQSMAVV